MKTSELTDAALDWAVNEIEQCCDDPHTPLFSTSWAQAGPIIEREGMQIYMVDHSFWGATMWWDDEHGASEFTQKGPTPLIAAMRCYVASKLGGEVDIPNELKEV